MEESKTDKSRVLDEITDAYSRQVQRVYHIRERLESMLGRFNGPQPKASMDESDSAKIDPTHIGELQQTLGRLIEESEAIENIPSELEKIA